MKKEFFLFDLDGTVTDPGIGITNSVMYALEKFGITPPSREKLYRFIGPPLYESFSDMFGMSREQAVTAVEYYREYYRPKGIFECTLYEGIPELFAKLCESGAKVAIATSKPEVFAKQLTEHFGLDRYLSDVAGSFLDGSRIDKAEVISVLMDERLNGSVCGNTVMTGDRRHDIIGGKKRGLTTVGVLYGYGNRQEHEEAGADLIAESVGDLSDILGTLI